MGRFHQLMIDQRHTHFERMRHAHRICITQQHLRHVALQLEARHFAYHIRFIRVTVCRERIGAARNICRVPQFARIQTQLVIFVKQCTCAQIAREEVTGQPSRHFGNCRPTGSCRNQPAAAARHSLQPSRRVLPPARQNIRLLQISKLAIARKQLVAAQPGKCNLYVLRRCLRYTKCIQPVTRGLVHEAHKLRQLRSHLPAIHHHFGM